MPNPERLAAFQWSTVSTYRHLQWEAKAVTKLLVKMPGEDKKWMRNPCCSVLTDAHRDSTSLTAILLKLWWISTPTTHNLSCASLQPPPNCCIRDDGAQSLFQSRCSEGHCA